MTPHFPFFFHIQGSPCRGSWWVVHGVRGGSELDHYTPDICGSQTSTCLKLPSGSFLKFRVRDPAETNSDLEWASGPELLSNKPYGFGASSPGSAL